MAQVQLQSNQNEKKARYFKQSLRIDMTPLVDLGFLLITFFIFTTTMAESKTMKLFVPDDSNIANPTTAPESATVSALLGRDNKVYVYNGKWKKALANNQVNVTNYDVAKGLGGFLRTKQQWLKANNREGQKALIYLIKPAESSSFQNVVDALDEATINGVTRYSISPLSEEEAAFMKDK